ncbi:MAG: 2-halobenzoate 1,2-dioxygenase large subunit [Alphaproteobacteria bacterium MarineAlpha11_Bin1]|nr:MAG: 2-halobenzoate 1,2-dioxygenase large subunit [Alphaproteobacteria bacterium MarineAlpha11_Bin1]|tara:strand:+ start:9412 stop:10716 length:1305 start_codon:yes stop_codon:yes gene_type:complete
MTAYNNDALRALVKPDRVHKDFYISPEVFDIEMDRIFGRSWLFLGHTSQVPEPGDYITTTIARQPIIMSRHRDGEVHVMFNRCTHRGAQVCLEQRGNAKRFECPYHAWVFNTDGGFAGAPYPKRYPDGFLKSEQLDLAKLPRMHIYRGFVFGSLSDEGPDIFEFLGPMKNHIDSFLDRSPDGEVEACAGMFRYRFAANWKLQMENQTDVYHIMFTHISTTDDGGRQFRREGAEEDEAGKVKMVSDNSSLSDHWESLPLGGHRYGHVFMDRFAMDKPNSGPVYDRYKSAMEATYGERAKDIMNVKTHNSIFYPHWSVQHLTQHIRVMNPISVNCTENLIIPLKLKGAPDEMWRASLRSNNNSHSPSGMVMSDDMEVWVRCQEGLATQSSDWVVLARGMNEEMETDNQGSYGAHGTSESGARNQQLAWVDYMCGGR